MRQCNRWQPTKHNAMMTNQPGPQQFASQNRLRVMAGGVALTIPVLAPTQHWVPAQQWAPPGGGGHGGNRSCNGRGRHNQHRPAQGAPVLFVGGSQMIPYIPAGIQPPPRRIPDTQTWLSNGPTKTCVSAAVLMWRIGILVPPATVKIWTSGRIHSLQLLGI